MAFTARTGLPEFWVTAAAKILIGDQPCLLEAWVKSRYKVEKDPASQSRMNDYKLAHTTMLTAERIRMEAEGWRCSVERYMKLIGKFAALTGKPDVIAQQTDKRPKIVDVKSGEPRDADIAQVKIYMIAVPVFWKAPSMQFDGEVVYSTHRVPISAHDVGPTRAALFPLLKQLGTIDKPAGTPTESNCRFCEVPPELCADRVTIVKAVETEEF